MRPVVETFSQNHSTVAFMPRLKRRWASGARRNRRGGRGLRLRRVMGRSRGRGRLDCRQRSNERRRPLMLHLHMAVWPRVSLTPAGGVYVPITYFTASIMPISRLRRSLPVESDRHTQIAIPRAFTDISGPNAAPDIDFGIAPTHQENISPTLTLSINPTV